MLLGLVLLAAPAAVQAQFTYTTNNGAITLGAYNGSGSAVVISNFVTSIATNAFEGCSSLTSVTIPAGVTSIGAPAFEGCSRLTAINVNTNNLFYSSRNGVLFDITQSTLVEYPAGLAGSYVIPGSVTSIGAVAFYTCTSLSSVTIPGSVNSIGSGAFFDCPRLTNATMAEGVTSIGLNAFRLCTGLRSITIPGSVASIGTNAFYNSSLLTSVYFQGNAPAADSTVFLFDNGATVYYVAGTTGWSNTFAGRLAVLWNPVIQTGDGSFGVSNNQFGFNITGTNNFTVVVEACTNLGNPVWVPLMTNPLVNGRFYFSEPVQTNSSGRFYGLGLP